MVSTCLRSCGGRKYFNDDDCQFDWILCWIGRNCWTFEWDIRELLWYFTYVTVINFRLGIQYYSYRLFIYCSTGNV